MIKEAKAKGRAKIGANLGRYSTIHKLMEDSMSKSKHYRRLRFPAQAGLTALAVGLSGGFGCNAFEAKDLFLFNIGSVVVKPKATTTYTYNSNIYSVAPVSPYNQGDSIFYISPGFDLRLGRPGGRNQLTFGYDYSYGFYASNSDLDSQEQSVRLSATLQGDRLQSDTSLSFNYSNSLVGGYNYFLVGGESTLIPVGKLQQINYDITETVTYTISDKSSTYVRGTFNGNDYLQSTRLYNVNYWKVFPGFSWKAFAKVSAFAEAFYGQTWTKPNLDILPERPDYESVGGYAGLRGAFTQKLSGSLKLGYENQAVNLNDAGINGIVAGADLTWLPNERLSATLGYNRSPGVSVTGRQNAYLQDNLTAGVRYRIGSVHPIFVNVHGSAGMNQYENYRGGGAGTTSFYSANIGLSYSIKAWCNVGTQYSYQAQNHEGSGDYTINLISAYVSFGL